MTASGFYSPRQILDFLISGDRGKVIMHFIIPSRVAIFASCLTLRPIAATPHINSASVIGVIQKSMHHKIFIVTAGTVTVRCETSQE
jgi:hypothetical protein